MVRVICQAVDELGNKYILKDDGLLEKRQANDTLIWDEQVEQEPNPGEFIYPNSFTLDISNDIWLTYSDQLNTTIRSGSTGAAAGEIASSVGNAIISAAGGDRIYAISSSLGKLYDMDQSTKALVRTFDLATEIPNFKLDAFLVQMAASQARKVYFGAITDPDGETPLANLVRFDPVGSGTFTCYPLTSGIPHQAVGADVNGNVYIVDLYGNVYRFDETQLAFDAMYAPAAPGGVVNIVTFDESDNLVLVDDGTFTFLGSKTRTINPANGDEISSSSVTDFGTVCGDRFGYQHTNLTRIDIPPSPVVPSIDTGKISIFVKTGGDITATGLPGAVTDADSVKLELDAGPTLIGSVTPHDDGSFAISGAGANPAGEAVTITATKGSETDIYNTSSVARNLPVGFAVEFQAPTFVQAGVEFRLKAKVTDGGTPVSSPMPIFRLKLDDPGTYFNTGTFVSTNGDYIQPTYDSQSELWYADLTIPTTFSGSATLLIVDSPAFSTNIIVLPEIADKATLDEVKTIVDELNSRVDIAFGAPAASFTDPSTIGGFLFAKLNDIQSTTRRLLAGIVGSRNVVVESILTDVSRQTTPKGSTPSIDITVFDAERRFPIDLTGGRVWFKAKANLESAVVLIDQEAELISATDGMARATLAASDTDTVQRLTAQIVVELPGTGILLGVPFFFDIVPSVL